MYLVRSNFRNSLTPKYTPETQVLHLLHCEYFRNAPKHTQTSSWVLWSRIDAFGVKLIL
jgi:hypothetical protein